MKSLVIIPTYNEKENIENLIKEIFALDDSLHILVVDDGSPDGTGELVSRLASENDHIHLLQRDKKNGLGRAYIAGFKWGIEQGFEVLVEMDADFSHRPVDLVKLLREVQGCDFVVGSRWVKGGGTVNWSWMRQLISKGGSTYARMILGYPIRDWTGGFNAWKANVLEGIGLDNVQSEGYSFQIELKYRAFNKGFDGKEVPIVFEERREGQSKMSTRIMIEALYRVWSIR